MIIKTKEISTKSGDRETEHIKNTKMKGAETLINIKLLKPNVIYYDCCF